jgi:hypothetical protein
MKNPKKILNSTDSSKLERILNDYIINNENILFKEFIKKLNNTEIFKKNILDNNTINNHIYRNKDITQTFIDKSFIIKENLLVSEFILNELLLAISNYIHTTYKEDKIKIIRLCNILQYYIIEPIDSNNKGIIIKKLSKLINNINELDEKYEQKYRLLSVIKTIDKELNIVNIYNNKVYDIYTKI